MSVGRQLRRTSLAFLAIGGVALLSIVVSSWRAPSADAGGSQYSMQVSITPTSIALGSPFVVQASINFTGGAADCDPDADGTPNSGLFGCYQAAQWVIEYDTSLINAGTDCGPSCSQIARVGAAPTACSSESVDSTQTPPRIQVGCLSLSGPDLNYSGAVFNITVQCSSAGTANFTLSTGGSPETFVSDGASNQSIAGAGDTIDCSAGLDTATPTATSTNTPTQAPSTNTPLPQGTATVAPRDTNTPTPEGSETPATGETPASGETPGSGQTPGQPAPSSSPSGTGGGGGVITGPDTGSGGDGGGAGGAAWLLAGLAVAGGATLAGGALVRRKAAANR